MNQRRINEIENERQKKEGDFDKAFKNVYTTFAGFNYDFDKKNTFDVTPEEREKFYHWLLVDNGGFMFWLANYDDTYKNKEANLEVCIEVALRVSQICLTWICLLYTSPSPRD